MTPAYDGHLTLAAIKDTINLTEQDSEIARRTGRTWQPLRDLLVLCGFALITWRRSRLSCTLFVTRSAEKSKVSVP